MKISKINPVLILIIFFTFVCILTNAHHTEKMINPKDIKRIVSISPSLTAEIIDLESENLLAGVTSYHPPLSRKIEIVGTYIRPNLEKIILLKPDLVMFSNEDNSVQMTEMLNVTGIKTVVFERNKNFDIICRNYLKLGKIIGKQKLAEKKINYYKSRNTVLNIGKKNSVAFFLSLKPLIGAGDSSFIGKIIEDAGAKNILGVLKRAYPIISVEHFITLNPDIVITTSINFKEELKTIIKDFPKLEFAKNNSVYYVNPDLICYYTPKNYINSVIKFREILEMDKIRNEHKN